MLLACTRVGMLFTVTALLCLAPSVALPQVRSTLEVRFVKVDRTSDGVKVTFTITNSGSQAIFLPIIDVPGLREPWALELLHLDSAKGWGSLGPFHDIPAPVAVGVEPKATMSFETEVGDPHVVVWPGKRVPRHSLPLTPLSGTYKLRVGFYHTESDWKKRLSFLEGKTSFRNLPKLDTSESEVFTISHPQ